MPTTTITSDKARKHKGDPPKATPVDPDSRHRNIRKSVTMID
jgi:hypothetical protein